MTFDPYACGSATHMSGGPQAFRPSKTLKTAMRLRRKRYKLHFVYSADGCYILSIRSIIHMLTLPAVSIPSGEFIIRAIRMNIHNFGIHFMYYMLACATCAARAWFQHFTETCVRLRFDVSTVDTISLYVVCGIGTYTYLYVTEAVALGVLNVSVLLK